MALKLEEIKSLIKESIPDAEISIKDLAGDDNKVKSLHWKKQNRTT